MPTDRSHDGDGGFRLVRFPTAMLRDQTRDSSLDLAGDKMSACPKIM